MATLTTFDGGSFGLDMRDMFPIANGPDVVSTTSSAANQLTVFLTNGFRIAYQGDSDFNLINIRPNVQRPQTGNITQVTVYDPNNFIVATLVPSLPSDLSAPYVMNPTVTDRQILFYNTNIATGFTITGTSKADYLLGGGETRQLFGGGGNDTIYGSSGSDTITGGSGNDVLHGRQGDDTYIYETGDTVFEIADEGTDTIEVNDLGLDLSLASFVNVENVTLNGSLDLAISGSDVRNVLTGNAGNNTISGGGERDSLLGGLGNDTLLGGTGNDTIDGGNGNDTLEGGEGNDLLRGGEGNDTLDGGLGDNGFVGGAGNDVYYIADPNDLVLEDIGGGIDIVLSGARDLNLFNRFPTNQSVTDTNVENATLLGSLDLDILASNAANHLIGNAGANVIDGLGDNDTIEGGAGHDTLNGDSGSDRIEGAEGNDTLNGGAGNDTFVIRAGAGSDSIADESGDDTLETHVTFSLAPHASIERLVLLGNTAIHGTGNSAHNTLVGNGAANQLSGGEGNDTIEGGGGADTLVGGLGNDLFRISATGITITEAVGGGTDTIESSVSLTLAANIDHLILTGSGLLNGTGNSLGNSLVGNTNSNQLSGGDGNDTLNGGGAGDTLNGGLGNDVYVLDGTTDALTDTGGTDTIQSNVSRSLAAFAFIENLSLTGTTAVSATGNGSNNVLFGNAIGNSLSGAGGNDSLNGLGGTDTMAGGAGNDTYYVNVATDVATETAAANGTDLVIATSNFQLGAFVENLTAAGSAGLVLTGNASANRITGGIGTDWLVGLGGKDTLIGGAGNDVYILAASDFEDVVTDTSGNRDILSVTTTASLGNYSTIEVLYLYDIRNAQPGTTNINGTGNAVGNEIYGNSGNNILDGAGGTDSLYGGAGNDSYVLGNSTDIVSDSAGNDTVTSTITRSLVNATGVENLTLLGTTSINGTGNTLNNRIQGNSGLNVLEGGDGNDTLVGGAGRDTLNGGLGNDMYVDVGVETIIEQGGIDTVSMSVGLDFRNVGTIENLILLGTANIGVDGNSNPNVITGNSGANRISGEGGKDTMTGGAGVDRFVFRALSDSGPSAATADIITDFSPAANEVIDFSEVDLNPALAGFQGATSYTVGQGSTFAPNSGTAILWYQANGNTYVLLNTDADTSVEMMLVLTGLKTLDGLDFDFF
ncbi:MAG: hypothetical protein NW216_14080 [Hyphomicrobium sp.]|nr:hypothetical protein [Hyphomicrobium sp.]